MAKIVSPTGSVFEYERIPDHDNVLHSPGKHFPDTHEPIDRKAVSFFDFSYGDLSAQAAHRDRLNARADAIEAAVAAASPTDTIIVSGETAYVMGSEADPDAQAAAKTSKKK